MNGMTDTQWDNLYFAILEGTERSQMIARFGESNVTFAENHPVVRAALAYRARQA